MRPRDGQQRHERRPGVVGMRTDGWMDMFPVAVTTWPYGTLRTMAAITVMAIAVGACGGGAGSASPTTPASSAAPSIASASASPSTGPTSAGPFSSPIADTPVGRKLTWYLDQLNGGASSLSATDVAGQFDAAFLAQEPAAQVVVLAQQLAFGAPFSVADYAPSADNSARAVFEGRLATLKVSIAVGAASPNLITSLEFIVTSNPTPTATWAQLDAAVAGLAPKHSLYAGEITASGCQPIHTLNAGQTLATGSTFKLFVLGELARQIQAGKASWDETLAVRDDWKSLSDGTMDNEKAGTTHTLLEYAQQMISISDNTAADHLIRRLGRQNVEANMAAMGLADPSRNIPFLTTRDLFVLKATKNATLRQQYLAADAAGRRALLDGPVAASPIASTDFDDWTTPRDIDTLEWFASTGDLCSAMAALHQTAGKPGLSQIQDILTINPAMDVDPSVWTYVGFKGGSEPGVLQMTWLLRRADNRWFAVSLTLDDPTTAKDNTVAMLSLGGTAMSLLGVAK